MVIHCSIIHSNKILRTIYMHICRAEWQNKSLYIYTVQFSSVQFSHSVVSDSVTPWTAVHQASLSITNSQSSLKLTSTESVMPSNHLILCHCLLLLPLIFPSIRVFSKESILCIRWPKYWSFSFNVSPSNEYSGLISFKMDWLGLLAAQGTLKSLLQHHSAKASILQRSVYPYNGIICSYKNEKYLCKLKLFPWYF